MQHTTSLTTAIQPPSHCQWYNFIGKRRYQLPEFIPSNSNSGLHSCISNSLYTLATKYVKNAFAVGAPPRTPLGSLQCTPKHPNWIWGMIGEELGEDRRKKEGGKKGNGGERRRGKDASPLQKWRAGSAFACVQTLCTTAFDMKELTNHLQLSNSAIACIIAEHKSFNSIHQVAPTYTTSNTWLFGPTWSCPHPKWHLNWFKCFCRAYPCDQQTERYTDHVTSKYV